jgi:hypothetical protein
MQLRMKGMLTYSGSRSTVTAGNLQVAVEGYDLTQELVGGDATRASPPKEI